MDVGNLPFKINLTLLKVYLRSIEAKYNDADVMEFIGLYPGETLTERHWMGIEDDEHDKNWTDFFRKIASDLGEEKLKKFSKINLLWILKSPQYCEFPEGTTQSQQLDIGDTLVHFSNLLDEFLRYKKICLKDIQARFVSKVSYDL